ncbi:signal peptidase II [Akkermansiaceae bacterium]|jgi:signal peptidase II|nr:signal peptidase II [Akkermansiaceae bacterium]
MSRLPKIFLVLSLPLYVLDQITKWWVVSKFREPLSTDFHTPDAPVEVIDGFLWWWRIHNQGVAFGLGNGTTWAPFVFLLVLVLALVLIFVFWKKGAFANIPARIAAALLVAGVLGNLTDRLLQGFWLEKHEDKSFVTRLSKGYVVDFIRVKLPGYEKIVPRSGGFFPTFNVADSCISVAAVLLFLSAFRPEESKNEEESEVSPEA